MRIYAFEYLDRIDSAELRPLMALAPFVVTWAYAWLLSRAFPRFSELGRWWILAIAVLAAVAGLVLTSVGHRCPSCRPHDAYCEVEIAARHRQ